MTGSPLNSLYHSVHSVYAPALLKNEAGRQELSGKVQVMTEDKCTRRYLLEQFMVERTGDVWRKGLFLRIIWRSEPSTTFGTCNISRAVNTMNCQFGFS